MEARLVDQGELIREMMSIPGKVISLHDGAYLFREGTSARYFYIVRSGHIFIVKYGASGRVLSLRLATTGSIIGELPIYEERPTYIFSAIARSAAEVYAIEFPVLQAHLEKHPHLSIALLKLIGQHMRKQHLKFRDLVLYGKKGGTLFNAHPICKQLRDGDGGRHSDLRAAYESGARKLLRLGARKSESDALGTQKEGDHRNARTPHFHQGYWVSQESNSLRKLRQGYLQYRIE